jgi:hypothetical protein
MNVVTINDVDAEVLEPVSLGALLIKIPAGAKTGTINVAVDEQRVTGPVFTVVAPPVFAGMEPSNGYAGTVVVIAGRELGQVNRVLFNGVAAVIRLKNSTRLEVIAPESTTGNVVLVYGENRLTASQIFTYLPLPLIRTAYDHQKGVELSVTNIRPVSSALEVTYDGDPTDILGVFDANGSSAVVLGKLPPDDIANPFDIVIASDGIKSRPFRYTVTPQIDRAVYNIVSSTQTTITYDISMYGRYFGANAQDNSATITFLTRLSSEVPNTIQFWSPTRVVTRITVDAFWNIGGTASYRDYFAEITVNGVISNRYKL